MAGSGAPTEMMATAPASNNTIVPYPNLKHPRSGAPTVPPVTLKFEDLGYKVKLAGRRPVEKVILDGVSGMVCPGEILGMLGPSGSGKTTLLTALGGRIAGGRLSGKVTYNSRPMTGAVKRRTGFVAQDDVLYQHLTVTETLLFTALLRLPGAVPRAEKAARVQRVVEELGLCGVAHTVIGGPLVRGVSGGERKRVSIGLELLVDPSLLLLDEPTSGLDSTTAHRIMCMLRRLTAGAGRTVVTTIHQPSSRLYHLLDKVVVLSGGRPIYYGPADDALHYFAGVGFLSPVPVNPADLLLDLANGMPPGSAKQNECTAGTEEDEQKAVKEQLISAYGRIIAPRLKSELSAADLYGRATDAPRRSRKAQWSTNWWEQFSVLLRRSLKERRHESFNKLRIFQVLTVATLGGLLWWRTKPSNLPDRTALIFFFSVFWGFFPLYNAVFTFPQERGMLIKERSSGMYRLSSYFLARTASDLPMELALPTAFVVIIYWMGGLRPEAGAFALSLAVVLYSVLVAQSLGLAIGALLMDVKQATTLASVTTLVFLIAGGYYVQRIPAFIVWLKYLSYSFYCYKLLLKVQLSPEEVYECSPGVICRAAEYPAIKSVGLSGTWVDVAAMAMMLVGYRLLAFLALHRMQPR